MPLRGTDRDAIGVRQSRQFRVVQRFTDEYFSAISNDPQGPQDGVARVHVVGAPRVRPGNGVRIFNDHETPGVAQAVWTFSSVMSVKSPNTLQHEVHGRGVCEHEVKVDVEALLDHLGRHDNVPKRTALIIFPEKFEHPAIAGSTFGGQETRVQKRYLFSPEH